ncbi:DUF4381 domain-containing protein [Flavobacteriaceae bacterium]|nr:DUF4381 domain-containing protein [Flavobacteriaceae bacterium]
MPEIQQIKDIETLREISIFPLGYGWWILIAIITITPIVTFFLWKKHQTIKNILKIKNYLKKIKTIINDQNSHQIVIELSEIIRFLAIRKFSRKQCAGLLEDQWLEWLSKNDPNKFDWPNKAKFIIEAPYMKNANNLPKEEIIATTNAILRWI